MAAHSIIMIQIRQTGTPRVQADNWLSLISDLTVTTNDHDIPGFPTTLTELHNTIANNTTRPMMEANRVFFCPTCHSILGRTGSHADNENNREFERLVNCNNTQQCSRPGAPKPQYFLMYDVQQVVQAVFQRPGVLPMTVDHYADRERMGRKVADVHNGTEYIAYRQKVPFMPMPEEDGTKRVNITFTLFTDGVSPYSKSSQNFWAVILAINEIPLKVRFKWPFMAVIALWPDIGKPMADVLLTEVVEQLNNFTEYGTVVSTGHTQYKIHGEVYQLTMDMPAEKFALCMAGVGAYEGGCVRCHAIASTVTSVTGDGKPKTHVCE